MTHVDATPAIAPDPAVVVQEEDDLSFCNTCSSTILCTCSKVVNKTIAEIPAWVMELNMDAGVPALVRRRSGWAVICGLGACHLPTVP